MPRNSPIVDDLADTRDGIVVIAGQVLLAATSITSQDIPGAVITRTGAGAYTVTFRDSYTKLLGFQGNIVRATAVDTLPRLLTNLTNGRTLTFVVGTIAAPGTGVDPAVGSKMLLEFVLQGHKESR